MNRLASQSRCSRSLGDPPAADLETLTYAGYLRLDELLGLQTLRGAGDERDVANEHFFIVIHQTSELWFRQLQLDLELVVGYVDRGAQGAALHHLQQMHAVEAHLAQQMRLLQALDRLWFLKFRRVLDTASGAQSEQFRALDRRLGRRGGPDHLLERVERAAGTTTSGGCAGDALVAAAHMACELWHEIWSGHLAEVRRILGARPGTGGTLGAEHLAQVLGAREPASA